MSIITKIKSFFVSEPVTAPVAVPYSPTTPLERAILTDLTDNVSAWELRRGKGNLDNDPDAPKSTIYHVVRREGGIRIRIDHIAGEVVPAGIVPVLTDPISVATCGEHHFSDEFSRAAYAIVWHRMEMSEANRLKAASELTVKQLSDYYKV